MDNQILKKKTGRPKLEDNEKQTIEEKREKRRLYMQKYNKNRYSTDPEYKEMKKEKAKKYYYSK